MSKNKDLKIICPYCNMPITNEEKNNTRDIIDIIIHIQECSEYLKKLENKKSEDF